jgi:5-methylcytosine-specific restriction endonuclease McrA
MPKDRERVMAEGGPLCQACRRNARVELARLADGLRKRREEAGLIRKATRTRRSAKRGSGRSGVAKFQRNRLIVLDRSDICGLCGHGGALTVDHVVSKPHWPTTGPMVDDFDDLTNLQPAHGTLGSSGKVNYCPACRKACNQSKGRRLKMPTAPPDWVPAEVLELIDPLYTTTPLPDRRDAC